MTEQKIRMHPDCLMYFLAEKEWQDRMPKPCEKCRNRAFEATVRSAMFAPVEPRKPHEDCGHTPFTKREGPSFQGVVNPVSQ